MDRPVAAKAVVALVTLGGVLGALSVVSGAVGPCSDDLAFQGPTTEVEVTVDTDERAVEVTHVDGDVLAEEWTLSVTAVVSSETGTTSEYVAVNASDGLPFEPRGSARIENVTVDGRPLSDGDEVRVVWRGHERPLPDYCLGSRGNATARVTLARSTVG
ncbi:hypothetical protein I7X12_15770 [Halosimplex litoreum]|uniref:Archaeal Type IV pilin N-terminal domain-containing protein n=1 Tax=Halosimplex litoreum TaxID=1198301 RepID=A0A7T3FWS2_9EURY|nr:hypothetical protein [Halosimplex litoreum]QPV62185.1 hypothetical protein I7X12_15770 [Halosimplex litoreum]